ncbi:sigma-54-dependent Fis family transcriptional regulator [Bacillota bacterium]
MLSILKSELFKTILDRISDGILLINNKGEIIIFNSVAEKILGYPKQEAVGKQIEKIVPITKLPAIVEKGECELNQTVYLNNTRLIVDRIPLKDNKDETIGALSIFRPFLEARELHNEVSSLVETRSLLQAIINSTLDAISVANESGDIILINPAYTRLTGLTEKDVLNQPATVDIPHGNESMHMKVLTTRQPVNNVRVKLNRKDRECIANVAPIFIDNQLKGSVGVMHDVSEIRKLTKELADVRRIIQIQSNAKYTFDDFVGSSLSLGYAIEQAKRAASTPASILLRGESGTGKEIFAHAIHNLSNRKNKKFVRVNCAALSENLLESELFGYSEGAFTGAKHGGKTGFFEVADEGTLFLDEIGELGTNLQSKLLRVLQEKEMIRVGDTSPISVDVRIIAATNANLEKLIESGKFREDLYYRINMIQIIIPPLRHRKEDIAELGQYLIRKLSIEFGRNSVSLSESAIESLEGYDWPGNVRELENILGRALINMKPTETVLDASHLPHLRIRTDAHGEGADFSADAGAAENCTYNELFETWEKQMLSRLMLRMGGSKTKAAKALDISIRNLYYKLDKHFGSQ